MLAPLRASSLRYRYEPASVGTRRRWIALLLPLCIAIACRADRDPSAAGPPRTNGVDQPAKLNVSDADPVEPTHASEDVAAPLPEVVDQAAVDVSTALVAPEPATPESIRAAWVAADSEPRCAALAGAGALEGDACGIVFDEGDWVLKLGAVPVSYPPTSWPETEGRAAISVTRLEDQLLVGVGAPFDGIGFELDVPGSDTLWPLNCRDPRRFPEPFFTLERADFGHAVRTPENKQIIFSYPERLAALELGSRVVSVIARHPGPAVDGGGEKRLPMIAPLRWTSDGLVVAIGPLPTFGDGSWELTHWLVDMNDEAARAEPRRYERALELDVSVVGKDDGLLLSVSHRDMQPGDPVSLWRSRDRGATWERVGLGENVLAVVVRLVVDPHDPNKVLIWGWRPMGEEGERKHLSSLDAGITWTEVEWVEVPDSAPPRRARGRGGDIRLRGLAARDLARDPGRLARPGPPASQPMPAVVLRRAPDRAEVSAPADQLGGLG